MTLELTSNPLSTLEITSEFGLRFHPSGSGTKQHAGIDLRAQTPQALYATHDGMITKAGWSIIMVIFCFGSQIIYIDYAYKKIQPQVEN
jgi:murein DD-endopeptidase MepM/ murein hydrolase activator NlpD